MDDHDAGWWEAQGANNQYFTHWWDPTNTTFPNFTRYLTWVAELKTKTARPQVVWQVPAGNQYFLTMNNTCGHYQDDVGPYFISHAADLFSAGLIAVLFGAGNNCQSSYTDAMNDGVTNNSGAPTTDLAGYCNACNTHVSTWPDDDGGYLRIFVGLYYNNAASLGGVIVGDPAAASWAAGRLDAFARGADNALWHRAWNGTAWAGWESLGGVVSASPAAVSGAANRIDVFVRGSDNSLWHRTWNGTAWQPWEGLGGRLGAGAAATSSSATRIDVFVVGADAGLWHRWWDGTTWQPWESLGGRLTSDPGSVSWGAGRLDVFARGADNAVWHRAWNGTSWQAWDSLGGCRAERPGCVLVRHRVAGRLRVGGRRRPLAQVVQRRSVDLLDRCRRPVDERGGRDVPAWHDENRPPRACRRRFPLAARTPQLTGSARTLTSVYAGASGSSAPRRRLRILAQAIARRSCRADAGVGRPAGSSRSISGHRSDA